MVTAGTTSALDAALSLAVNGWRIFPCRAKDKLPLVKAWPTVATSDAEQIRRWWAQFPDAMIGLPTGREAGVWVLDADVRSDGRDGLVWIHEMEEACEPLPGGPTSATPSGGRHFFFRYDPDEPVTNRRGKLPPGVDVRGDGGFVVLPPSVREDGQAYIWLTSPEDADFPDAPRWLLSLLRRSEQTPPSASAEHFVEEPASGRYAESALERECRSMANAPSGTRNQTLNTAAFNLGQLVGSGALASERVRAELIAASCACGLYQDDPRAVEKTIASGLRAGIAQPRTPPERIQRIHDIASDLLRNAGLADPEDDGEEAGDTSDPYAGFVRYGEATDPPPALVKGLLPKEGIAFVGGQSGAGKTFLVCHLAACLAAQQTFFGRQVKERVGVAIMAAEGAGTLPLRLKVAGEDIAGDEPLPIAFLPSVPNLMDAKEVERLGQRLKALSRAMLEHDGVRLGAVIVDTVAAAFEMQDEDSNAEAARAIRRLKTLGDALGALVIGVHHFGKDPTTGLRGASAWRAGADTVLSVLAERNQITGEVKSRELALAKSRVGEEGPVSPFALRFVKLGEDEDGDDIGACIVIPDLSGEPVVASASNWKRKEPRTVRAFRSAFHEALEQFGEMRPVMGDGPSVRMVALHRVREAFRRFYATGEDEEKAKGAIRVAWHRALQESDQRGIAVTGTWGGEEWGWAP